ncbi:GIY-YIG nuclease family protein [Planctomicrobium sp. SH664]|uniref:GIY-YIG nuclease family protein n=1 Tax=Planctomicrobium sp. SH664 TaxID=3448125 RepID=UPI003F5B95BA
MSGKTIRLYLVNGLPTDILTAEIINWTGKVIVTPRSQLAELAKREEVRRTGVYCLVGPDPENALRDAVYFGEGDNVLTRLTAHDRDETKDFWTRCALVISKDQNITKSHGRYLESRLISIANQADRSKIHNGTAPPLPPLPESDVADMEYFLGQLQLMLPVLGFNFLQPKPKATLRGDDVSADESPLFELNVVGAQAKAREIKGEFIVLKGSTARKEGLKSWTSYKALRDQLVEEGKLVDSSQPGFFVLMDDIAFSSPSAGGAVVNAGNINGRTAWKTEAGETYQEWHERKLAKVIPDDYSDDDSSTGL